MSTLPEPSSQQEPGADDSPLVAAARRAYGELTQGEIRLLEGAESGHMALMGEPGPGQEDPARADTWGTDHLIHAELLGWLVTSEEAVKLVHRRGIRLQWARISGQLKLGYATLTFPLELEYCSIPESIDLEYASLPKLSLQGSRTGEIWAERLSTSGEVRLSDGFQANGTVFLHRARISGDLVCEKGSFSDPENLALTLQGARIEGSLNLGEARCRGAVSLVGATIQGDLIAHGLRLVSEAADKKPSDPAQSAALNADRLNVKGSVFLRQDVEIQGGVRFVGAAIAGDLDCSDSRLLSTGRSAIAADRIVVGGDVLLRNLRTDGILVFLGSDIKGDLNLAGSTFEGEAENGLRLETATIQRTLYWNRVTTGKNTYLWLDDSSVGRLLDDKRSWPALHKLSLLGFRYERTSGVPTPLERLEWLSRHRPSSAVGLAYEQLAGALRRAGHPEEARRVSLEREKVRSRGLGISRRIWRGILGITIGYGYAPRRSVLWAAGVILLGALVFHQGYEKSLFIPVSDGVYRDASYLKTGALPAGYPSFNPFVYSLDTFLPIVDLHQKGKWLPNASSRCTIAGKDLPCGRILQGYHWLHILVGWAITTLAVIGFTGLIRKD